MNLAVYTAVTGGYDELAALPQGAMHGISPVAFVDTRQEKYESRYDWDIRPACTKFRDPNRNAKIHKVLSHTYFPGYEYSLWIDGNLDIRFSYPVAEFASRYLAHADLAVFRHPHRRCLYAEAAMCLDSKLDDADTIMQQMIRYTKQGYPANNGLIEASVLLRRHTPAVIEFNNVWWEEIELGSRRDQLSFNYVVKRLGLRYAYIPGNLHDENNGLFARREHVRAHNRRWADR